MFVYIRDTYTKSDGTIIRGAPRQIEISDEQIKELGKRYFKLMSESVTSTQEAPTYSIELFQGCATCDAHEHCMDAFYSNAVHCNNYGKEKKE